MRRLNTFLNIFFSVYYYFILLRCCNYFLDQASELWYTFGVEDDEGISEDSFFSLNPKKLFCVILLECLLASFFSNTTNLKRKKQKRLINVDEERKKN
jgi:hypothetical protein